MQDAVFLKISFDLQAALEEATESAARCKQLQGQLLHSQARARGLEGKDRELRTVCTHGCLAPECMLQHRSCETQNFLQSEVSYFKSTSVCMFVFVCYSIENWRKGNHRHMNVSHLNWQKQRK